MKKMAEKQLARLTDEKREEYLKKYRTVKRNRTILFVIIGILAVVIITAALSTTVLFNIRSIKVKDAGRIYTGEEIISASGLDVGDNMVLTDFENVKARIEKNLPYVFTVSIKKTISGEVIISVKDNSPVYIIKSEGRYALADKNGKVLEIVDKSPENKSFLLIKVKGSVKTVPGEKIEFVDREEDELIKMTAEALSEAGLFKSMTEIDVRDKTNIKAVYENRFRFIIGMPADLLSKFEAAGKTIAMEDEADPNAIGEINLTILKKIFVKPLTSLDGNKSENNSAAGDESEDEESAESGTDSESVQQNENGNDENLQENTETDSIQDSSGIVSEDGYQSDESDAEDGEYNDEGQEM